jgi:hypothetical protein
MVYLMATLAGVDIVDCALSPLGNGTAQPATEPLVATLKGHERDTNLDLEKLSVAAKHFRGVADKLFAQGIIDPKVLQVDTNTLTYQVPERNALQPHFPAQGGQGRGQVLRRFLPRYPEFVRSLAIRPLLLPQAR